jgi:hypothetical protein
MSSLGSRLRAIFTSSSESIRTILAKHRTSVSSVLGVLHNLNIKTETNMSILGLSEAINATADLGKAEVRTVPFGTFAGTLNRLVAVPNADYLALDTGDQGGGQN